MKLSIFYDHLRNAALKHGLTIAEVMHEAVSLGIGYMEISLDELLDNRDVLCPAMQETGMRLSSIYCSHDWSNGNDMESYKRHVDTALAYGAQSILVIPGQLPAELLAAELWPRLEDPAAFAQWMDASEAVQRMVAGVRETIAYAAGRIPVTMEDYDFATAPYASMLGLMYFLEHAPGLGLAFDTGNFAFIDEDAMKAYALIGQHTVHMHCKDRGEEPAVLAKGLKNNRGLAPVPVGGGYIPIAHFVRSELEKGYDGIFAIEHFGAEDQLETMRASAGYMHSLG